MKLDIRTIKLMTIANFICFIIYGFVDNLKGSTLSSILVDQSFSHVIGGSLILWSNLGSVISVILVSFIFGAGGRKSTLIIGLSVMAGSMGFFAIVTGKYFMFAGMALIGGSAGIINLSSQSIIASIHSNNRGKFLNLLTFFYGVGAMSAPLFASLILLTDSRWRNVYLIAGIPVIFVFMYLIVIPYKETSQKSNRINMTDAKKLPNAAFIYLFVMFFYSAIEAGIATWLVEYLSKVKIFSFNNARLYLSIFFITIMIGRLIGGFFVDRVGYLLSIISSSIISLLFVLLGIILAPSYAVFIPLSGLFFSIVFPTIVAAVTELTGINSPLALGLLFSMSGLGKMFGPWIQGLLSDAYDLQTGFSIVFLFNLLMLMLLFVNKSIKAKKEFQND